MHALPLGTLGTHTRALRFQRLARIPRAPRIQRLLKHAILPAKEVVAMLSVARAVAHAVDEGLGTIGGPDGGVVEGSGVPHY